MDNRGVNEKRSWVWRAGNGTVNGTGADDITAYGVGSGAGADRVSACGSGVGEAGEGTGLGGANLVLTTLRRQPLHKLVSLYVCDPARGASQAKGT